MKKYRYLLKNIGLLTISSFGTKLITFFLVPLYTSILTTQEYGTYDLFNTTISLLMPILTINIQDGVLRFSLGEEKDRTAQTFSYGIKLVGISSIFICIFTWINQYFDWVKIIAQYPIFFVLLYVATAYNQIFMNIARGVDRVADVSIAGVISALTGCLLNIWLLVFVKIGLDGYFLAAIGTALAPCVYLGFRLHLGSYCEKISTNS
jgi:O-antigen/teichoic acid export membrane protein